MALKILQPGIQPLGQFDLKADEATGMVGGEVGIFHSDASLKKGSVDAHSIMYGLLDEGIAGYGTMLGEVEHVRATWKSGAVVVGPHTSLASNKATLWTKPGLYGVTSDAWEVSSEFDGLNLNNEVYASATAGLLGKLTIDDDGVPVALFINKMSDSSLVSTTASAAGATPGVEYAAIYLLGVQAAV